MKKQKVFLTLLSIFFCIAVLATVLTLSLNATGGGIPAPDKDGWREVCCGEMCEGGEDYCIGSGNYTCCK